MSSVNELVELAVQMVREIASPVYTAEKYRDACAASSTALIATLEAKDARIAELEARASSPIAETHFEAWKATMQELVGQVAPNPFDEAEHIKWQEQAFLDAAAIACMAAEGLSDETNKVSTKAEWSFDAAYALLDQRRQRMVKP